MITPEIHRDRYGSTPMVVSFDGFEVTATELEIVNRTPPYPHRQLRTTATAPMFYWDVMLKARFSLTAAALYRNAAEVAVALLQETAPKYAFYHCDSPYALGIAGKEFAVRDVRLAESHEIYNPRTHYSNNSTLIAPSFPTEVLRARVKCLEIFFHAHCKDV